MVRRKRLRNRVLAIMMALCLVCGTVQMSTVVYATDETGSISEQTGDADSVSDKTDEEENTELSDADGGEDDASSDTQSGDSDVAEDDAQEETTAEGQESESDESVVNTESTEESDGSATTEEEALEEDDASAEEDVSSESVTTEEEVIVEETLTTAAVYSLLTATLTAESGSKTLTVDADATEVEGETYTTIQEALDYINGLDTSSNSDAKDNWKITVNSGNYVYFTVNQSISNLTITGESGATVDCSSGSIQLVGDTITLEGLTFTATNTAWSVPIIKDSSSNAGIYYDSMVTISNCTFTGNNAGCAVWLTRLNSTIQNCSFDGFGWAIEIINETSTAAKIDTETTTGTITINRNTVTDCDFFIHYGVRAGITLVVTDNVVTGSADKVCASLFAWDGDSITVTGNTFSYSAFGLQNSSDGTSAKAFLSTNTFDEHSYAVDDYYNYSTGKDYSAIYYAPEIAGKTPVWSVSSYAGSYADAFAAALTGHENDNPLIFVTENGSGDEICMGLAYFAINLNYDEDPDDDTEPDAGTDLDLTKSKEATELDENYESDVTISIPADNYTGYLDVAFVLDGSTSHDNTNLAAAAANLLDELLKYDNLTVKVSITVFGGIKPILKTTALVELTDETVDELKAFLTEDYKSLSGRSGSNLQAGVEKARELLNADTSVDGDNKYMVILTDGAARMWYDSESNEAVSQTYLPDSTIFWNSNEDWTKRYGTNDTENLRSFEEIWNAGQTGTVIGKYGMTYSEYKCASIYDSSIASWDTVANGSDYYTTYEAACYYAATSIVAASEEVNVCMITYQYHPDLNYGTFTEDFKTWLETYVTRYDLGVEEDVDEETTAAVFAQVKDDLIHLVDAGSVLVDEIGDSVDADGIAYDFDFINDISYLTLTVDGEALSVTQIDDYTYGFGSATGSSDGTTYPFVLTYYPDGTTYSGTVYDECFVLEINVPITKNDQVKLTYGVALTNPQDGSGTYGTYDQYGGNNDGSESYGLYTNNVARLYPVDSNGNSLPPEDFQKPTVSYTIVNIEVTKVWSDSNDQDEIRPDSVTISLLKNGTETGDTLVLSSGNGWTGSFVRLRLMTGEKADIYTISEAAVTGYITAITGDASTGFTITNSHTVTTTGTEESENDTDTTEEEETETETTESTVASEAVIADTGDNAPLGLAILIAAISEFTLIILIFQQMRKKRKQ